MTTTLPISRSWLLALGILFATALWMLSGTLGKPDRPASAHEAAERQHTTPVVGTQLSTAETMISQLVLTGRTRAARQVSIKAETAGSLAAVLVARGAAVDQGEILLRFATDERAARLLEARSRQADAQTRYAASRQLKRQGYQAEADLARTKAALDAASAAVAMAELELQRIEVRAPFAGVVNERYVETGDFIDRGQTLALLVELDPMRIVGQVSERYVGQIRLSTQGTARTLDGRQYSGQVSYVGHIADPTTRTIPVELQTPNPDGRLIEGITAELSLPVDRIYAHRVPPSALSLADNGMLGVKTVSDADTVRFHPIRILGDSDDALWVGGLPERIHLITVGQAFVQPGQTVQIAPPAEPAP